MKKETFLLLTSEEGMKHRSQRPIEPEAAFGQRLQITYGDEYYWNTANCEAFAQLPWDSDDRK